MPQLSQFYLKFRDRGVATPNRFVYNGMTFTLSICDYKYIQRMEIIRDVKSTRATVLFTNGK